MIRHGQGEKINLTLWNVILNKELQGITSKIAGANGGALKGDEEALKGNVKTLKDDEEAIKCDQVC